MEKFKQKGFILVYTLIIMGVIVIIISVILNSVLSSLRISVDETESLKAFYAAEAGLECVRYYNNNSRAFYPTSPSQYYNCGIGSDFLAGSANNYNFTIEGFSNGACTNVTVDVITRSVIVDGVPTDVYNLQVISSGKNSCSASGANLVERVRWEDM